MARIEFSASGEVTVKHGDVELPDDEQAAAIRKEFEGVKFPSSQPFLWSGKHLPQNDANIPWSKAAPENIHVCWDQKQEFILFVQERHDPEDRKKEYAERQRSMDDWTKSVGWR